MAATDIVVDADVAPTSPAQPPPIDGKWGGCRNRPVRRPAQLELAGIGGQPTSPATAPPAVGGPGLTGGFRARKYGGGGKAFQKSPEGRVVRMAEKDEGTSSSSSSSSSSSASSSSGSSGVASGVAASGSKAAPKKQISPVAAINGLARHCWKRRQLISRRHLHWIRRAGDAREHFTWSEGDELGRGAFGRVYQGKSRYNSKRVVAVKQVSRDSVDDVDTLWAEISILSELDHPNVLRFLEAYEDRRHIYIITEACLGGDLRHWQGKVCGNVDFTLRIAREVTSALAHCHAKGICHRDLKLRNILLMSKSLDSVVRVADFGLAQRSSKRVKTQRLRWAQARASPRKRMPLLPGSPLTKVATPSKGPFKGRSFRRYAAAAASVRAAKLSPMGGKITSVAGTPEYMAPEVIRVLQAQQLGGHAFYDFRCDIWSLGVVVFSLLTDGYPYTVEQIAGFVADGVPLPLVEDIVRVEFLSEQPQLCHFLGACLNPDFRERPSAEELLYHPCLFEASSREPPTPATAMNLVGRLRCFTALTDFKRAALLAAARHLGDYEHEQLRKLFQRIDFGNSGAITMHDLHAALADVPTTPGRPFGWIEDLAERLGTDDSGEIGYTEFIAAAMDHHIEDRKDLAWAAFCGFDLDGDGFISKPELEFVLKGSNAGKILALGDLDHDGELSFNEFVGLLRHG